MPLVTSERQAVQVLVNRIKHYGADGLQNFARNVLGAHHEQAKRLADAAKEVANGRDIDTLDLKEPETVSVQTQVNGREFAVELKAGKLPITSYEELVEFYGIDTDVWKPTSQSFSFWGSQQNPNFQVKATFIRDDYQAAKQEDREQFREWAAQFAPKLDIPYVGSETGKMLELVVSDLHADRAGSLEEHLDRVDFAVTTILRKVRDLYGNVDEVNLVFLGDTFNSDNMRDITTNGTPQDSEPTWRNTFRRVRETIAQAAVKCARVAPLVKVHIIPGNHDFERSYYLADTLWAYFHNTPNIEVVLTDSPRRYLYWGTSVIGLAHGDRAKPADMAMTMFREADTSGAVFLEWHLGHEHTRREEEVHGVNFQWFRSPADPSEWELQNFYGHNRHDIVGIVWDRDNGPEDTFRVHYQGSKR